MGTSSKDSTYKGEPKMMKKSKPARGDYYNVWDDYMPELKAALKEVGNDELEKWVIETHDDIKDILRRLAQLELRVHKCHCQQD